MVMIREVSVANRILAFTGPIYTDLFESAAVKPVPLMVKAVPVLPLRGENELIDGCALLYTDSNSRHINKRFLNKHMLETIF